MNSTSDPNQDEPAAKPLPWYRRLSDGINNRISPERRRSLAVWGNRVLLIGVLGILVYRLSLVGWGEVLAHIPLNPLFYIIFAGIYLVLPVAESYIYHVLWAKPFKALFPIILKKRVFNKDVLNYSGEAQLFLWGKQHLDQPSRLILRDIKDNSVISSLTSMLIALSLLSIFLSSGLLPIKALLPKLEAAWVIGGAICLAMLISLGIRFRKSVIALPAHQVKQLFLIHVTRNMLVMGLQILQWMIIMPDVPITAWFTILSAQIIANQIPLIPSKDFLVVAAGAELAAYLDMPEAGVTSMLLVNATLDKIINFLLFSYLSSTENRPTSEV